MISFIIPAYNAAKYLKNVVLSIIGDGSYNKNIEIVIVENGSTDNTTAIAESLSNKYANIRVLHSEKGVSNARNKGIKSAKGEWIAFVDADDCLVENALDIMFRDIRNIDADLFLYGHQKGNGVLRVTDDSNSVFYSHKNVLEFRIKMLENPTRYMQVWSKLFKRDRIVNHNIEFDTELRLAEDSDFTLQYSSICDSIYVSPEVVYQYTIDNVSTMRGNNEDKINDYVLSMTRSFEKIKDEDDRIIKAFKKYILMHLNIALVRDVFCVQNSASFRDKIMRMKTVLKEEIFANAISFVKIQECMSFRMIPILGLKYRLYLFSGLVYSLRAYMNKKKENK